MNKPSTPAVVAEFSVWADPGDLVGRRWQSHDGPVEVLDRTTPGGLRFVRRADGREHAIRPAIIAAALAESEIR